MKPVIVKVTSHNKNIPIRGRLVKTPCEIRVANDAELSMIRTTLISHAAEFDVIDIDEYKKATAKKSAPQKAEAKKPEPKKEEKKVETKKEEKKADAKKTSGKKKSTLDKIASEEDDK